MNESETRAQAVFEALAAWGVDNNAQLLMLGLENVAKVRDLKKYQLGSRPLPSTDECIARQEHILGIAKALQTSYPSQPQAGINWMHQRNSKLQDRNAIQCALQDGIKGMVKIRTLLDCAWAWHQDDEHNPIWK